MRRLASIAFPGLFLILAPLVMLSPVILTGKALFWGTPALQFMPWREYAWDSLIAGQLPLWNPWLGMGAPLFANYQAALAYPFTWSQFVISWLGGIEWAAWWQGCLVVLHWIVAAAGMARLAKGLGLGRLAQAVSGLAFGLGGYLVSRAGFLSINAATAWLPWIVYYSGQISSSRLRGGSSWKSAWLKLTVVCGLQLLSGHAQTAWYTLLLAVLWSGYWGWLDSTASRYDDSEGSTRYRLRIAGLIVSWLRLAASYALGAGLASIQLIPTAEYLAQSQRAGQIDFEYAMTYSLWPWRFLTLLAPDLFGSPASGDYWGYANYWEDALYIGLLPLLLAVSAVLGWIFRRPAYRKPDRLIVAEDNVQHPIDEAIPFLAILIAASFLLALGNHTPIFPWLYSHIPTFDMFQAPTRISIWAAFGMALLAGYGAHHWRRPGGRALYWTRLGTAGAVAVMIGAGLAWYLMGDVRPTFIRAAALAGMWGVGAGFLSLLAPKPGEEGTAAIKSVTPSSAQRTAAWMWAVAIFVATDLIAAGWGLNPGIDSDFYSTEAVDAAEVRELLLGRRLYLSTPDEEALKFDRFLRFDTFVPDEDWMAMRTLMLPNLNMFDRIASLSNFDPLVPSRYSRWMEILSDAEGRVLQALLDLSGAGAVEVRDLQGGAGVTFVPLTDGSGSRARWVPCARGVPDGEQAMLQMVDESFDADRVVILEGQPQGEASPCEAGLGTGQVVLQEEQPGKLVYRVTSDNPGWLLLSDTWYPGWKATIDGADVPIYRADYLFRSISLPAGEHEVRFEYRPLSFYFGLMLCALSCLALAVIGILSSR